MSEKKHELYIIAFILLFAAGMILWGEVNPPELTVQEGESASFASTGINVNTAGVDELIALDSIGKSKAEQIVKYRAENGFFYRPEDLLEVPGIGEKILEKIIGDITF